MENKARQSIRLRYIIILIAAGLAFFFALRNLFFFDEDIFVTNTKSVFMKEFLQRCTTVKITYLIDNFFWKNNSTGYHITNLLLHLINAILALKVLMQLVSQIDQFNRSVRSDTTLLIFFILFLITPIHSEPLCYILGRDGLLVATFCLLSILSFLKAQFKSNIYIIASLLFFLLALFSYEVSWTMPLIVLCIISYCCYVKNVSFKKHILSAAPYFLIFAVWFVIKIIYLNKGAVTDYNDKALMKTDMLLLIKNNAALFLRNFIPPFENIAIFLSLSSIVFIASLLGFVKLYKVNKQIFALALLLLTVTFLALFPASLFGIDMHDSESERYIYFSSAFALMLLALLITTVIKRRSSK